MGIDPVSLAISVALTAANMALTASQTIEGPRLDSTKFTSGDYNAPLDMVWGKRRGEKPIFWAEDLKEVKRRRKTKGGKYNEYTYFGTWAIALAGHEISAVTRVWFDTHLVFDLTGAGPITPFDFGDDGAKVGFADVLRGDAFVSAGQAFLNGHVAIYLGTEDQEPDPRILATTEAKNGEGTCPAYRGTAYIAFKDVPLEKLGNRIPQCAAEIVSEKTSAHPSSVLEDAIPIPLAYFLSADRALLTVCDNAGDYSIIDLASRSLMITGALPTNMKVTAADPTGRLWGFHLDTLQNQLLSVTPDGKQMDIWSTNMLVRPDSSPEAIEDVFAFQVGAYPVLGMSPVASRTNLLSWTAIDPLQKDATSVETVSWSPKWWTQDADGDVWAGGTTGHSNVAVLLNVSTGRSIPITAPTTLGDGTFITPFRHFQDASHDHFIVNWPGYLIFVDRASGAVIDTVSYAVGTQIAFRNCAPSSASWFEYGSIHTANEYSAVDGSLMRSIDFHDWAGFEEIDQGIYDPVNHAWIGFFEGDLTWYYLDRVAGDGVPLSQVEDDVAAMVGATDCDFSAHTDLVNWSATQGQGVNIVEPLQKALDCAVRPHDFGMQGIKFSGVSGGTITTDRFVKADPRYSIKIRQAAELPVQITVSFADTAADQQPNSAVSRRTGDATEARGIQQIDMSTWATDATTARDCADRYFRRMWNERREVSNALTAQYLAIEPGDCETLDLDGEVSIYRCDKVTIKADGALACDWKYDHPSLALTTGAAGAEADGHVPDTIAVAMISKAIIIDGPYLADSDAQTPPTIYGLAGPFAAGAWPGAVIYEAIDGEYSQEVGSLSSTDRMTWGYVDEAFAWTNPNLWDRGSVLTVRMRSGSLTGTTEAACDTDPEHNLAAIGVEGRWEYVQFTGAELIDTDVYELTGFKRGRRGTEWAAELHTAGDVFALVETRTEITMGLSDVGTDEAFKAITAGRSEAGAFPSYLAPFTGGSLKPYAPCQLEAEQDSGTGDWALSWVRRTRLGGAWVGGTSIPLAEASEAYEVDIVDDSGAVIRTYDGLTSPEVNYPAADQIEDFGVVVGSFDWRAYQISDAVGRGYAGEGAANGGIDAFGLTLSDQWRVRVPIGAIDAGSNATINECEMRGRFGGHDQCSGGAPSASTERSGHAATYAFDDVVDTASWQPNVTGATSSWLQYTFAAPVFVAELVITSPTSFFFPAQVVLEYWDGASWIESFDSGAIASWPTATRVFNVT